VYTHHVGTSRQADVVRTRVVGAHAGSCRAAWTSRMRAACNCFSKVHPPFERAACKRSIDFVIETLDRFRHRCVQARTCGCVSMGGYVCVCVCACVCVTRRCAPPTRVYVSSSGAPTTCCGCCTTSTNCRCQRGFGSLKTQVVDRLSARLARAPSCAHD